MSVIDRTKLSAAAQALLSELEAMPESRRDAAWLAIGEMVHDCAECAPAETVDAEIAGASWVNNRGFAGQLEYLFEHNPEEFAADIRVAVGLPALLDPDLARRYGMMVALSADDVSLLRRCDVARVVDAALDCDLVGFPVWLAAARPDLAAEIEACTTAAAGV